MEITLEPSLGFPRTSLCGFIGPYVVFFSGSLEASGPAEIVNVADGLCSWLLQL